MLVGMCVMAGMGSTINPIMQKLIELYPDVSVTTVRTLSTIVSLLGVIVSIPLSAILGARVKYKVVMIIGTVLALGGFLPILVEPCPFWILMLSRVMLGVGFGCLTLRNAAIRKIFADDDKQAAAWLGYASVLTSGTAALLSPIVGMLADIYWKYAFCVYAFGVIPLLINIFIFQEPEDSAAAAEPSKEKAEKPQTKGKLDKRVFLYSATVIFGTLISFPIFTGISTLVTSRGLGEAAVAGTITSAYTLGQVVISAFFGLQNKVMGRWVVGVDLALCAAGFGLITIANNAFIAIIGAFILGAGFMSFSLSHTKWAGDVSDAGTRTFASTLLTTSISIGSFFSSYWIVFANKVGSVFSFLPTDAERTYLVGAILFAVLAVIFLVRDPRPKLHE